MNKLFLTIGVVLFSTTPLFSVTQAQQSSQTRTLLEIQQLRQEISELRDMIERQQYQIRKMQRAQSGSGSNQTGSQRPPDQGYSGQQYPSGGSTGANTQYSGSGQDVPQSPYSNLPSSQGTSNTYGDQANSSSEPYRSYDPSSQGVNTQGQSNETGDFGSNPAGQNPSPSNPNGANGVEERIINAPPAGNDRANGNYYPPVEDRSIGRPPLDDSSATQTTPTTGAANTQQGYTQRDLPQTNVPNGQQQYDPYAQQRPQSVPNRLPEQSAGGVIQVPPPSNTNGASQNGDQTSSSQGISGTLSESDYYNQGFGLMKQSKFEDAVTIFEKQLETYPQGDSADDAHYWIAEAMYVSRDLQLAKKHLKTLIDDYPQSRRVPDAMLKTAYIEQQQGNQIEARILFQEIVNYHPKSDAAIAAKNRLAENN